VSVHPQERFVDFLRFRPVDRPPLLEESPWTTAADRWRAEGMDDRDGLPYLRECDPLERTLTDLWMLPRYEEKILEEDERSFVQRTDRGAIERVLKPAGSSMPLHIRYPVESREDWLALKPRMLFPAGRRQTGDFDQRAARWRSQGTTVIYQGNGRSPSLFGYIRELMGAERALTLFYDDPWLVEDMMETSTELCLASLADTMDRYPVTGMYFWEDMAYKAGPLISPAMFRRYMLPRYKRITDYARRRGVQIILVDSDGDIRQLIPLWLEGGLDGVYPLEVAAGMDVVALRRQYGRSLMMKGGIDKRALFYGKAEIDQELARVMPVVEQGGYIPTIDHAIPPNVPWANMVYYWQRKKQLLGIA
jgi:hypothetical protein